VVPLDGTGTLTVTATTSGSTILSFDGSGSLTITALKLVSVS
jgi:hypothetical protein